MDDKTVAVVRKELESTCEISKLDKTVGKDGKARRKPEHARQLNIARRHINQAQKRALIADQLRATPEKSNRDIASTLGVDHKTVISVRESLERTGEIPQLKKTVGKDGKARRKPERQHIPTQHIPEEADNTFTLETAGAMGQLVPLHRRLRLRASGTSKYVASDVFAAFISLRAVSFPKPSVLSFTFSHGTHSPCAIVAFFSASPCPH